jgi:transposase
MLVQAGTDISARWFDVCLIIEEQEFHRQFENSRAGLRQCILWFESLGIRDLQCVRMVMEPTGRYGELVAEYFYRRKVAIRLAQPFMFHRYAESLDMRGKSDFKDSFSLARYCLERWKKLRDWRPKAELECELRDTQMLIRSLTKRSVALQSQLQCGLRSSWVAEKLRSELLRCENDLDETITRAIELIRLDARLSSDLELLMGICGIAEKSAVLLLTLINFRDFKTSRALACFLGLTNRKYESGESVRGKERISKRGNGYIRAALFMPARAARMHNPAIAAFSARMEAKGKHDWAIQMAVIRKLVTTAWAVVTNQFEWDPNYSNPQFCPT